MGLRRRYEQGSFGEEVCPVGAGFRIYQAATKED